MKLHEMEGLKTRNRRRVGRGPGSGSGKTSGRGHKGQGARAGASMRPGFEGGQMPLQRRVPKGGFTNIFKTRVAVVGLRDLARLPEGETATIDAMRKHGLIKGRFDQVKVLVKGELSRPVTVEAHAFSQGALSAIEAAGGTAVVVKVQGSRT